jgi:hypothetical protein
VIGALVMFGLVGGFGILPAFLPIGDARIYGPRRGR